MAVVVMHMAVIAEVRNDIQSCS